MVSLFPSVVEICYWTFFPTFIISPRTYFSMEFIYLHSHFEKEHNHPFDVISTSVHLRYPEKTNSQSALFQEVIFDCSINHKQKLDCPIFKSTFLNIFEWSFPIRFRIDHTIFFELRDIDSSSYSFVNIGQQNIGYVSRSEPQKLRQTLTFIDVILHY